MSAPARSRKVTLNVVAAADPKATGQLTLVTTPWAKVLFSSPVPTRMRS